MKVKQNSGRRCFHRKRIQIYLIFIGVIACICVIYQYINFRNLDDTSHNKLPFIKSQEFIGVHASKVHLYEPNILGTFTCLQSKEKIAHTQINDDYCDCLDGSDEPGTSACTFTKFNCASRRPRATQKMIPSSRVNDGICDCCDGSDEWLMKTFESIDRSTQIKTKRYLSPCPNLCP